LQCHLIGHFCCSEMRDHVVTHRKCSGLLLLYAAWYAWIAPCIWIPLIAQIIGLLLLFASTFHGGIGMIVRLRNFSKICLVTENQSFSRDHLDVGGRTESGWRHMLLISVRRVNWKKNLIGFVLSSLQIFPTIDKTPNNHLNSPAVRYHQIIIMNNENSSESGDSL
jgi:hypothetical protein